MEWRKLKVKYLRRLIFSVSLSMSESVSIFKNWLSSSRIDKPVCLKEEGYTCLFRKLFMKKYRLQEKLSESSSDSLKRLFIGMMWWIGTWKKPILIRGRNSCVSMSLYTLPYARFSSWTCKKMNKSSVSQVGFKKQWFLPWKLPWKDSRTQPRY